MWLAIPVLHEKKVLTVFNNGDNVLQKTSYDPLNIPSIVCSEV